MSNQHHRKSSVFPAHNVPLLVGMFLSTLALVLTIPVTMIGLSEQQLLSSEANSDALPQLSADGSGEPAGALSRQMGNIGYDQSGKCVFCPSAPWVTGANAPKCITLDKKMCSKSGSSAPTPSGGTENVAGRINDSDSRVEYTGSWAYEKNGGGTSVAYKSDYHQSPASLTNVTATTSQGSAKLTFTGKKIGVTLLTWINRGIADIYIDGQLVNSLDGYYGQIIPKTWTSNDLSCGQHTVEVKHTGRTTAPKKGTMVLLDYFTVGSCDGGTIRTPTTTPTPTPVNNGITGKINDNDSPVTYTGSWAYEKNGGGTSVAYKSDYHQSPASLTNVTATTSQGSAKLTFTGKKIGVTLLTWINRGIADIYVDGQLVSSLDGYYGQIVPKTWTSNDLTCGQHTVEVKHTGKTTAPKKGTMVLLDYFTVGSCGGGTTGTPTTTPTPTTSSLTGDVNHDGKVDLADITLVVTNFSNTTCGNIADLDGNCVVNIYDYNIVAQNFGKTTL